MTEVLFIHSPNLHEAHRLFAESINANFEPTMMQKSRALDVYKEVIKMKKAKYIFQQIGFGMLFLVLVFFMSIVVSFEAMIDAFRWHLLGRKYCKKCGKRLSRVGEVSDFGDLYVCLKCRDTESEAIRTVIR